jgi:tRNA pseudouridine55 synthase
VAGAAEGLLLIDKPSGVTSHDVVDACRRVYGERSIGHLGTLDPFATGLLVLLFGKATRLATFIDADPKVYEATVQFGAETDTDDVTGTPTRSGPVPPGDAIAEAIRAALPSFTGEIQQVPPAYSAKHVAGHGGRAYVAARRGQPADLPASRVVVYGWQVRAVHDSVAEFTVTCGTGTYIRALARDLGRAVGSAAHLTALRRTQVGKFDIRDSHTLPEIAGSDAPPPIRHLRVVADDA